MAVVRDGRFGRLITAMVTPFDDGGALDLDAARDLARFLCDNGSDGLVVAGTTGEGPVLSDAEKLDLFAAVAEAVSVPVIAGTGTNNTAHDVELARRVAATGASGILVVGPYYSRPNQSGIAQHVAAVAGATDLPVMVYDVPVRTGRRIATDTLLGLARDVRNVVAVKDASGDLPGAARMVAEAPGGFEVYAGDDNLAFAFLAIGAVGLVAVASHWCGPQLAAMLAAVRKGDLDDAIERHGHLLESFAFETSERWPNPLPAKAALRALGHRVGQCRLPMGAADAALDAAARDVVARLAALDG